MRRHAVWSARDNESVTSPIRKGSRPAADPGGHTPGVVVPANPATSAGSGRLVETLAAVPVVAILRAGSAKHLVAAAEVIADAGIRAVEFPLTTPGALDALRGLRSRRPDLLAGAGTVCTPAQVSQACAAGAQFLVAPCTQPSALAAAADCGVVMVPGAFTATEITTAMAYGAEVIKLFPATLGPRYLRALREPLPAARLVPTGGIDIE